MQKASAGISKLLHYLRGDGNSSRQRTVKEAVLRRDVKRILKILHNGKNKQVIRSALCSAVTLDETSMLQSILDQVKHSNVSDNLYKQKHCQFDISPLHVACSQGKEESVSLLLKAGFTANVVDEYNSTPLFWAIYQGHRSVADVLLSIDDIDVNSVMRDAPPCYRCRDLTVLMWASYIGDVQSVIGICRHNPFPHVVDESRETPLHKICRLGNIGCVLSLLSCGAEINAHDERGETPLYLPCCCGHTDIVEVLLQSGVEEEDIGYSFALTPPREWDGRKLARYSLFAAIERRHPEIVSLLILHGANIDIKIHNNGTPLHVACSEGTLGMVKTLVNNGSCINAKTYSGQTPLFYCLGAFLGCPNVHRNIRDIRNRSLYCNDFDEYIQEGNDIMEYLIKKGANLSCKDDSGRTALEHAIITDSTVSTFILLKYGGRISVEYFDKLPWNLKTFRDLVPKCKLFRLLLRSNFEFRKLLPVYLEKIRDETTTRLLSSFLKEVEEPLSLKYQCRISIRNMISTDTGVQSIRFIYTLGLPKLLQGFLMFDDFD